MNILDIAISKKNTRDSLQGAGALKGQKGDPGKDGKDGTTYTPQIGAVTTISSAENATANVVIDEDKLTAKFNFNIPRGAKGDKGEDGVSETTPHIGENGNWWFGDTDSGISTIEGLFEYADENKGISDTPVGQIISYMGNNPPKHYLFCDGTEYNIADYPYLSEHIKKEFGSYNYFGGDGITTFAIPDLRGEFLRGSGENSHTYTVGGIIGNEGSGENVGVHQGGTIQPIICSAADQNSTYGWVGAYAGSNGNTFTGNDDEKKLKYDSSAGNAIGMYYGTGFLRAEGSKILGTTRPTNTAVLYCIKYEPTYFINTGKTANNLTTTEEGFSLDARQGKVLKDEIDTLNSITFGEVVDIGTTTGTTYTFNQNGYLQVFADYAANTSICVLLSGIEIRVATGKSSAVSGSSQCVYVKKGMRINVLSSNGICFVKFFPLI